VTWGLDLGEPEGPSQRRRVLQEPGRVSTRALQWKHDCHFWGTAKKPHVAPCSEQGRTGVQVEEMARSLNHMGPCGHIDACLTTALLLKRILKTKFQKIDTETECVRRGWGDSKEKIGCCALLSVF
jgi:hypothetical protein